MNSMPYKNSKSPEAIKSNLKKDRKYKAKNRELLRNRGRKAYSINPKKYVEKTKRWQRENREKYLLSKRKTHLKGLYKLTTEEYEEMLRLQNGLCIICFGTNPGKRLFIDHDHETGKVRGLLCSKCNFAIGLLNNNILLIKRVIKYLEK